MKLTDLTNFLDDYLSIKDIEDTSLNGLQVESKSEVHKVALATDACMEIFKKTAALRADLLLAHHGLFWGKQFAIRGIHAQRIKTLITNGISLYAVHLPLDLHPEVGNNVELIKLLGFEVAEPFGVYHGIAIGYIGRRKEPTTYTRVLNKLQKELGVTPAGYKFGKDAVKTISVISGGGASMIEQTTCSDIDLFLTGESHHVSYHLAKELQVNLVFSGHYATETLGVRSLGRLIEEKFGLETVFIDVPTGM